MKNADIALYAAKADRRGSHAIFQPVYRAELQHRLSMVRLAKAALNEDRLVPFYQPKVDLVRGNIVGFEALLRWRHGRRSIQGPDTIAAAFEDIDLANAISDKMIEQVLADVRRWLDQAIPFGHVALNAAAAEFRRAGFAERLLDRLHKAEVPPNFIHLEVTENVFLGRGADYVSDALKILSEAGVRISLDDFGTGFSSLSYLRRLPIQQIKIDRGFVQDATKSARGASLVNNVIRIGLDLGQDVLAEGVETMEQHAFMVTAGCSEFQGYLYGRPMTRVDFERRIELEAGERAAPSIAYDRAG